MQHYKISYYIASNNKNNNRISQSRKSYVNYFLPNYWISNNNIKLKSRKPVSKFKDNLLKDRYNNYAKNINKNIKKYYNSIGQVFAIVYNIKYKNNYYIDFVCGTCNYVKINIKNYFITCLHLFGNDEHYYPIKILFIKHKKNVLKVFKSKITKFYNIFSKRAPNITSLKQYFDKEFDNYLSKNNIFYINLKINYNFLKHRKQYLMGLLKNNNILRDPYLNIQPIPSLDIILLDPIDNNNKRICNILSPINLSHNQKSNNINNILDRNVSISPKYYFLLSYQSPSTTFNKELISSSALNSIKETDYINNNFSLSFIKVKAINEHYISFIGNTCEGSSGGLIFDNNLNPIGINFGCYYDDSTNNNTIKNKINNSKQLYKIDKKYKSKINLLNYNQPDHDSISNIQEKNFNLAVAIGSKSFIKNFKN